MNKGVEVYARMSLCSFDQELIAEPPKPSVARKPALNRHQRINKRVSN